MGLPPVTYARFLLAKSIYNVGVSTVCLRCLCSLFREKHVCMCNNSGVENIKKSSSIKDRGIKKVKVMIKEEGRREISI
jgi:hypothetical protein